jgi:hypothetical protein
VQVADLHALGMTVAKLLPAYAFAQRAVTLTGADVTGCEGGNAGGNSRQGCNQGVGNGPEDCDPGNSNQGDPDRSNDERGGKPGSPGRKGGPGR